MGCGAIGLVLYKVAGPVYRIPYIFIGYSIKVDRSGSGFGKVFSPGNGVSGLGVGMDKKQAKDKNKQAVFLHVVMIHFWGCRDKLILNSGCFFLTFGKDESLSISVLDIVS